MPSPARLGPGWATGIGSWPGTDIRAAIRVMLDECHDLPYLPELPARGAGADITGRTAARLTDLPVDLQPHGWRLTSRPGRDVSRAQAFWREDLDQLAEYLAGWVGPLKVQLMGPWSLAATLWLPRGERALADAGARRDIIDSLCESSRQLLLQLRQIIPGAEPFLQFDEPALPAVLAGHLPTASGYGSVPAIASDEVRGGLAALVTAVGPRIALHCCAAQPPVELIQQAGVPSLSWDSAQTDRATWERIAEAHEAGLSLWPGVPDPSGVTALLAAWRGVGLTPSDIAQVVLTPSCGLAGYDPAAAQQLLKSLVAQAAQLADRAAG